MVWLVLRHCALASKRCSTSEATSAKPPVRLMIEERPIASTEYEKDALSRFKLELSAEEYAARYGHQFALFNYDNYRYQTDGMTEWVDRLSDFFFADDLQGRLRAAREKYLTLEEIEQFEAFEQDPF